jgi:2'-5' RNA ligase
VSAERERLFVALELPPEVREGLQQWRGSVLMGTDGVRAVRSENLHVTLCFLGWRARDEVDAITEACGTLTGRGAVELVVGEAVALPRRRPRVLAVSLEDPGGALGAAQAALSAALAAGGWYEPEERAFYAHVTVARAGRGARIPPGALVAPAPPRLRFRGSRVVLYRSHLRRGGASYEARDRIELDSA